LQKLVKLMAEHVTICEVSPRDGLQHETTQVATDDKVRLIDLLSASGLSYIEAASFVSPRLVPQMADGAAVLARVSKRPGVTYSALTPNIRGFDAAKAAGANEVAVFASASETFSQHNINCSIAESLERFGEVTKAAKSDGLPVRGYVSCAIACPYEGAIAPENVAQLAASLFDMGCREVSLGDTIGVAHPEQVERLLATVLRTVPANKLAGHFHDTQGRALACIRVALHHGLRAFDSSVHGIGGCPFAPGAKGNVATESVVQMLAQSGFETGLNMSALAEAGAFITRVLGRSA
jgi:hydroxymethylglutaryl-CoA lyase